MKQRILIVEDDTTFGIMLQKWFTKKGIEATLCSKISAARKALSETHFDLVITDLHLPDGEGTELLDWMKLAKIKTPVFVMTGYGDITSAVSAIKLGAEDYLEKPINPSTLYEKVKTILLQSAVSPKANSAKKLNTIFGKSAEFQLLYKHILKIAPTNLSVLILGESGTGKEYAARMIHENSTRKDKPFMAIDCGSLSRELAPSELFGHIKGAFTSAINDKKGVFELADGGTVFLDEVGNLPYDVQIQLLRALQERRVRPVGSSSFMEVDVRILAATNENILAAIAQNKFREDFYYRLNEFSIIVPPLRDRKEDIALFAQEFLMQAKCEIDSPAQSFSNDALKILSKHSWNGNVRELRNYVRRQVLFAEGQCIEASDLQPFEFSNGMEPLTSENERQQIEDAIAQARGNKTLAAQLLHIDRKTLYNKMHLWGIKL